MKQIDSIGMCIIYTAAALLSMCIGPIITITESNCSCGHYPKYDWAGPYCSHWIEDEPPFCFLSGESNASICPGAVQLGNETL